MQYGVSVTIQIYMHNDVDVMVPMPYAQWCGCNSTNATCTVVWVEVPMSHAVVWINSINAACTVVWM